MEETVTSPILEEKIYVAVGRTVWKNTSNLMWALQNYQGSKICIVHIHQPSSTIPVLGTKFEASTADEELVRAYRGKETTKTDKILQEYLSICLKKGIQAEKLCIEMDSIEKGIVETIYHHRIRKFVMGAAADKHYSMEARMDEVRALSSLLSEFQRLVLPHTSTNPLQEVGSLSGQNERESNRTSLDILSRTGRSDEVPLSEVQEEPNDSSSHAFPRNGNEHDDKLLDQLHQVMANTHNPKP
ncbi:unnamed protein product [Arabis nemorensis]|uniref:RING-type E3 ubiquitin transferase n=1 Tax=Arabis nemorensis TaxID=586526 RepID=A0A565BAB5_9BRAS|nr:unnamed protein product [Arabis nemorensis]